jgi:hypothetical protein
MSRNQNKGEFQGHGLIYWLGGTFMAYIALHIILGVAGCEFTEEAACVGQLDESAYLGPEEQDAADQEEERRAWAAQWRSAAAWGDPSFDLEKYWSPRNFEVPRPEPQPLKKKPNKP